MTSISTRFFPATAAVVLCAFAASAASAQTANRPPTVTGTIPTNATDHVYYSWRPYAKDPDGDTLRFSVTGLPSWAQFNTSVGRITGTPRAPGRHPNVSITVTDGHYTKKIGPVTIVVAAAPTTPPPTTPPPTSGSTLSERYPGDVGIAADSAVIFADPFEDS